MEYHIIDSIGGIYLKVKNQIKQERLKNQFIELQAFFREKEYLNEQTKNNFISKYPLNYNDDLLCYEIKLNDLICEIDNFINYEVYILNDNNRIDIYSNRLKLSDFNNYDLLQYINDDFEINLKEFLKTSNY